MTTSRRKNSVKYGRCLRQASDAVKGCVKSTEIVRKCCASQSQSACTWAGLLQPTHAVHRRHELFIAHYVRQHGRFLKGNQYATRMWIFEKRVPKLRLASEQKVSK